MGKNVSVYLKNHMAYTYYLNLLSELRPHCVFKAAATPDAESYIKKVICIQTQKIDFSRQNIWNRIEARNSSKAGGSILVTSIANCRSTFFAVLNTQTKHDSWGKAPGLHLSGLCGIRHCKVKWGIYAMVIERRKRKILGFHSSS